METIFAPLDADEALPRELLQEAKRYRRVGRSELAGALWLPALLLILFVAGWGNVDMAMVLGVILLVYVCFWVFVLSGERKAR